MRSYSIQQRQVYVEYPQLTEERDKNDPPIVQLIQTQLDSSCMWLYEQEIFPSLPVMSEGEKRRFTFNIQEAELSTKFGREPRRSYALVCPRAAFPVASDGREKAYELQFVCYCDEKTHKSDLNYNGRSLEFSSLTQKK